jgi:L-serine dehydratase
MLELIDKHKKNVTSISDLTIRVEQELTGHSEKEIIENAGRYLQLMKKARDEGLKVTEVQSGMVKDDAKKMHDRLKDKNMLLSDVMLRGTSYALAVMACNAAMGRIVAAPTAGSAGIVPACLFAVQEKFKLNDETMARAMICSAGVGMVIAHIATFSAAKAGCQAEIGASSAMAAAAISEARGMKPDRCINAAAIALKNMLGLACDPIGGLVEVPCVKRNAIGVSHAMTSSDMSYAGITSVVPFDEVVQAMNNVAENMNPAIRETSAGGLATTPTGKRIAQKLIQLRYKR